MNPIISVIIPFFNTKAYLQEAIDSTLLQSIYIQEIILIDDGSNDGSGELVELLYSNVNKIKIIHKENEGQGVARNIGVELAKGEFIYFFDSDDILKPNLFKTFYTILEIYPELELFCFSGESFLDPKTKSAYVSKSYLRKGLYKRKIDSFFNSGEDAFNKLVESNAFFAGPPFYIFKRSVVISNQLKFLKIKFEDEEFTHKLFLFMGQTFVTKRVFFKRRVRTGSTMQINKKFIDLLGYFETLKTLERLREINHLKNETKINIENRINHFTKTIIELKTRAKMLLTKEEKKRFRKLIFNYLKRNQKLMFFYFLYPISYKLRMLKKNIRLKY